MTVYDLIAENTIEEQIKKLQESKSALAGGDLVWRRNPEYCTGSG
ncbi:MAG: hypothetical protein ACLR78_06345 [Roseburia sp.]